MPFALLAETSYAASGVTYELELYEQDYAGPVLPLKVLQAAPPEQAEGEENMPVLKPHLVADLRLRVKDDGRALLARFANKGEQDFRLDVREQGLLRARYNVLLGAERPRMDQLNPVVTLEAWDGVTALKAKPFTLTGWYTVGELIRLLLDEVGHELDTFIYFTWQHANQSTSVARALGLRHRAEDLKEKDTDSYYDVLMRLLSFWQMQLVQDAGDWHVVERAARGNDLDYLHYPYGGAAATGTMDRRVTIDDSSITRLNPLELARQPVARASSTHKFDLHGIRNERFEEQYVGADGIQRARYWTTLGGPTQVSLDGRKGIQHDQTTDGLAQSASEGLRQFEVIDVTLDVRYTRDLDVSQDPNTLTVKLARVVLTNTPDGIDRYLTNAGSGDTGSWSTSEQFVTGAFRWTDTGAVAGFLYMEDVVAVRAAALPVSGTLRIETLFDPTAGFDVSAVTFFEASYARVSGTVAPKESTRVATGAASTTLPPVEEAFRIGDYSVDNPTLGIIQYLDATTGNWTGTSEWGGGKGIHQKRAERRLQQQALRLSGMDVVMPPSTSVGASDAIVYGGKVYVPEFVGRQLWSRRRRVVAYELRADSVTDAGEEGELGPAAPRPNPTFSHSIEDMGDGTLKVYLHVQQDGRTACIEFEYIEGSLPDNTDVVPFNGAAALNVAVNPSDLLGAAEEATVRAWGWSGYDAASGAGRGLRQLVPVEIEIKPGLTYVPVSLSAAMESETATTATIRVQARGIPEIDYVLRRRAPDGSVADVLSFNTDTGVGGFLDSVSKLLSTDGYAEYWVERLGNAVTAPYRVVVPRRAPTLTLTTSGYVLGGGPAGPGSTYVHECEVEPSWSGGEGTLIIFEPAGATDFDLGGAPVQVVIPGTTSYTFAVRTSSFEMDFFVRLMERGRLMREDSAFSSV